MIFSRDVGGGNLVETEIFRHGQANWLVVAAGISAAEGRTFFPVTGNRAARAETPMSVVGAGSASLLFVLRAIQQESIPSNVTTFSSDIPFIEFHTGYFRLTDIDNSIIKQLRWEWDLQTADGEPIERWLIPWRSVIGYNPAHAPSHLHFNSPPLVLAASGRMRQEHATNELRLAIGVPNPLALLLSIAVWLRTS